MRLAQFLYLLPYFLSYLISISVSAFAWQRRHIAGTRLFALMAAFQGTATLGYIFEILSPTLEQKLFWDQVQWVPFLLAPWMALSFSLEFTQPGSDSRVWKTVRLLPALAFCALLLTNPLHNLVYPPTVTLVPAEPFDVLLYPFTTVMLLAFAYCYALVSGALFVLVRRWLRVPPVFRPQIAAVFVGLLIPALGGVLLALGIRILGQRDLTPFTFSLGNLIIAWGILRYRLFEQAPTDAEARYQLLAEHTTDMVSLHRPDGAYLYISPSVERTLGYSLSELQALAPSTLIHPDDRVKTSVEAHGRALQGESVSRVEYRLRKKDGEYIWVESMGKPILDAKGQVVQMLASSRDITERKQAEQQRLQLELERERMGLLTNFVQGAAHEFRTSLSTIGTSVYLLQRSNNAHYRSEKAAQIEAALSEMTHLLDDMLEIVRLDSTTALPLMPLDLHALLHDLYQRCKVNADARGVTMSLQLDAPTGSIQANGERLRQAMAHLFDNAVQYTPSGGAVSVLSRRQDDAVLVEVCDTGIGMTPEQQQHIFESFYRADDARTERGFGLGLPIAQRIIHLHGGSIAVRSAPGAGSAFTVRLPLAQAAPSSHL